MIKRVLLLLILILSGCTKASSADKVSTDEACPKDLLGARGKTCGVDGKICTAGPGASTHFLMCSRGKWAEMEAPPPPAATAAKTWDLSCKKDDDCVVVRAAGCCPSPCPAGVVNKTDQERVEADLAAACKKGPSQPCISAGACRGHSILCEKGTCGIFYEGEPGYRPRSN